MSPIVDLTLGDVYQARRQNKVTLVSNGSNTLIPNLQKTRRKNLGYNTTYKPVLNCTKGPSESEKKKGTVRLVAIAVPSFCPGQSIRYSWVTEAGKSIPFPLMLSIKASFFKVRNTNKKHEILFVNKFSCVFGQKQFFCPIFRCLFFPPIYLPLQKRKPSLRVV